MTLSSIIKSFNKPIFYYIGGILNAIFFGILFIRFFDSQDSTIIKSFTPSPNGEYVAIAYINMGGGAAGYCYTYMSVGAKWHPKGFNSNTYSVVGDRCGSNMTATWLDNGTLSISNLQETFFKKYTNNDGKIKINYQ